VTGVYTGYKPVIKFDGEVMQSEHAGAAGDGPISVDILKELETHPRTEPYSVLLEKIADPGKGTRITLKYVGPITPITLDDPTDPSLVIDKIGKPPVEPGTGRPGGPILPHRPRGARRSN
jgi:hypothetical protein